MVFPVPVLITGTVTGAVTIFQQMYVETHRPFGGLSAGLDPTIETSFPPLRWCAFWLVLSPSVYGFFGNVGWDIRCAVREINC